MLNYADTASSRTIVPVEPVPQNPPSQPLGEPETLSALFACPDFRPGFALGREICGEEGESDDIPHNEEEIISFVISALSSAISTA